MGGEESGGLEVLVLGPTEARGPAGPVVLGGRRQRAVLALLALDPNRVVSTERLIDGLWAEDPPPTAQAALQNAVSALRKALDKCSPRVITKPGGYLLAVEAGRVDAKRFEQLVAVARQDLSQGRAERAILQLQEAIGLWRGVPLEDLSETSVTHSERTRLEELRLAAEEELFEAELALGRHAGAVAQLRAAADAHPYRERRWRQLMLALYRCGRQADALDAYQTARKLLAGDLGVEPGPELQELEWAILNHDARLRAPSAPGPAVAPLPVPPTPFIGRASELERVLALLADPDVRLLTFTGPPGTGKTRLALAAASAVADRFHHIALVELASLSDPELILPETLVALGLREPTRTAVDAIRSYAADRDVLVVLDNFEHLLDGATALSDLLTSASRLRVLVTSRIPLRLSGEREYPVPPLALPQLERLPEPQYLASYDAVALFVDRARAVQPDFALTAENSRVVAEICVRLDGLPLAIALTASRLRVLPPELILSRLRQRLRLVTGGPRDAPVRQRTLRAAIDWSHDLLREPERVLFARLSVFVGEWTLEAAELVCNEDQAIGTDVLEVLASLIEQSLLRRETSDSGPRFGMLESIREYAEERLHERGEADRLRRAHARFFTALAEDAYQRRFDDERGAATLLDFEQDNLRAALGWASSYDPAMYVQLAGALAWYWTRHWVTRAQFPEARRWLDRAIRDAQGCPDHVARARTGAAFLAALIGETTTAIPSLEAAIELWEELGDRVELAFALDALAWAHFLVGDIETATREAARSLALYVEAGAHERANRPRITICQVLVAQWKFEEAEPMAREALAAAKLADDMFSERDAWHLLADCALMRGDAVLAERRYREALRRGFELRNPLMACIDLQGVAIALGAQGRLPLAASLDAVASDEFGSFGFDPESLPFWKRFIERYLSPARAQRSKAQEVQRRLTFEEAVEVALDRRGGEHHAS